MALAPPAAGGVAWVSQQDTGCDRQHQSGDPAQRSRGRRGRGGDRGCRGSGEAQLRGRLPQGEMATAVPATCRVRRRLTRCSDESRTLAAQHARRNVHGAQRTVGRGCSPDTPAANVGALGVLPCCHPGSERAEEGFSVSLMLADLDLSRTKGPHGSGPHARQLLRTCASDTTRQSPASARERASRWGDGDAALLCGQWLARSRGKHLAAQYRCLLGRYPRTRRPSPRTPSHAGRRGTCRVATDLSTAAIAGAKESFSAFSASNWDPRAPKRRGSEACIAMHCRPLRSSCTLQVTMHAGRHASKLRGPCVPCPAIS